MLNIIICVNSLYFHFNDPIMGQTMVSRMTAMVMDRDKPAWKLWRIVIDAVQGNYVGKLC